MELLDREIVNTHQKALQLNLDARKYGSFAEIGAGQEVARWFFRVGGAAGTMAKSLSAYDKRVSDSIYGASERYVSGPRLLTMLEKEFEQLMTDLGDASNADTCFFSFADTVAARSYRGGNECHGWMGIRFQPKPGVEPHDIIMHVRMLDPENLQQQEALGIVGVNLIYGAFFNLSITNEFIVSLVDDLGNDRIEIDMLKFCGPGFKHFDNRLLSLQLVQNGLTNAAVFDSEGQVVQPSDLLYKKNILVERGSFRPVAKVNLDMMDRAKEKFIKDQLDPDEEVFELMEITMSNLMEKGGILDHRDFLARVDLLISVGKQVLVSNYAEFYRLADYLHRFTHGKRIAVVLGVPLLREIFKEDYYTDLQGGILAAFGRLFQSRLKLYAYPSLDRDTEQIVTAETLKVEPHLRHLYRHVLENGLVEPLSTKRLDYLSHSSRDLTRMLASGDPRWEEMVEPSVAETVKEKRHFGYNPDARSSAVE